MTKRRRILTALIPSMVISTMLILSELPHITWYLILGGELFGVLILTPIFWNTLPTKDDRPKFNDRSE